MEEAGRPHIILRNQQERMRVSILPAFLTELVLENNRKADSRPLLALKIVATPKGAVDLRELLPWAWPWRRVQGFVW